MTGYEITFPRHSSDDFWMLEGEGNFICGHGVGDLNLHNATEKTLAFMEKHEGLKEILNGR